MDYQNEKCVIVMDEQLPVGILANTAVADEKLWLIAMLGQKLPEVVGDDVVDQSGQTHLGIIAFPVPILKGSREGIRELLEKLRQPEFQGVVAVDFSELAQGCKTYCDYITKMGNTPETDLSYLGLAICGSKRLVNQLTGSLPLLR